MKKLLHWLAHKTENNTGKVVTWWHGDRLMVAFQCDGCGYLSGVHESVTNTIGGNATTGGDNEK